MVKVETNTANKRKSLASDVPAKKAKVENGNSVKVASIKKKPLKQEKLSPGKGAAKGVKGNKKPAQIKSEDNGNAKPIKQFKGTKQLQNKSDKPEGKKKRKNMFASLITEVKAKEGSKDPELLKKLNEKMNNIRDRDELTKTAKKKLSILSKMKLIVEEGSQVASDKIKVKVESEKAAQAKAKAEKKAKNAQVSAAQPAAAKKKQKPKAALAKQVPKEEDSDDEEEEEEDSDAEAEDGEEESDSDAVEGEDNEEEEEDDDGEEEEEDDDEEEEDDESDEEEEAPAPKGKQAAKGKLATQPNLEDMQKSEIIKKGQKRFVLFVGNIPYDTSKQDLMTHFSKVGDIVHIRIPTHKHNNLPRGFAYVEVNNEIAYEKCLSLHHSQIKGRRINVLYTQGGKKKGVDKKKEIKAKNLKLHAMRNQGKLAGSVKQTNKRSFRRNKAKINKEASTRDS